MTDVGALIIASAAGSGFGGALALGRWGTRSVLEHLVGVARAAHIDDVVVVLGPREDDIIDSVDVGDATFVVDSDWREGAASALRAGLDTMWRSEALDTALVLDLEYPNIDPATIDVVLSAHRFSDEPATLPKYRYTRGFPIAIGRDLWSRLMGLEGALDIVGFFDAHREWAAEVWIDSVPPTRVETRLDLEALAPRR